MAISVRGKRPIALVAVTVRRRIRHGETERGRQADKITERLFGG